MIKELNYKITNNNLDNDDYIKTMENLDCKEQFITSQCVNVSFTFHPNQNRRINYKRVEIDLIQEQLRDFTTKLNYIIANLSVDSEFVSYMLKGFSQKFNNLIENFKCICEINFAIKI